MMFRDEAGRARMLTAFDRFRASLRTPPESRTVPTRFGDTHVLVTGPEAGPPLVLLHGALATSAHAVGELGPLARRFRIHAPDIPGQSVKSADVRLSVDDASHADWLVDVLDALELPRAHVYGVSWGGFVARLLAEVAPERIDRLVLLVPAGITSGSAWRGFVEMGLPMTMYRLFPSEARLARFTKGLMSAPDPVWASYFAEAFQAYRLDLRVPPLARPERLARFDRPTLVIAAADDVSFPGRPLLARVKELLPHAETRLLEDCRHVPPTTEAFRAELGAAIERFLTGA